MINTNNIKYTIILLYKVFFILYLFYLSSNLKSNYADATCDTITFVLLFIYLYKVTYICNQQVSSC